jgi:hypothetical protein
MARKPVLDNLPFRLAIPVMFALFYLSVLLYVLAFPFVRLYGLLLCPAVWIEWGRRGKDVLVVDFDSAHSKEWMERILPLVGSRAVFLNYSNRDHWNGSSLENQLYEVFGPHGMPERFTVNSLPAVILFIKLRRPKVFTFGNHSKDREDKMERLRSELAVRQ